LIVVDLLSDRSES